MELPAILNGALAPIDPPDFVPRSIGTTSTSPPIDFEVARQEQSNWCWAAVAVSVAHFFDDSSQWLQCSLVNAELRQSECCINGTSSTCNKPWYLDRALRRTENFHTWSSGRISASDLIDQLAQGAPVAVRIGWNGGGGHFVAISECMGSQERRFVVVQDPWSGKSTCEYREFAENYKGSGRWTHTYLTKGA